VSFQREGRRVALIASKTLTSHMIEVAAITRHWGPASLMLRKIELLETPFESHQTLR
jgi:hypothetical protein